MRKRDSKKSTDGLILLPEDDNSSLCRRCTRPAIFRSPALNCSLCLNCVFSTSAVKRDSYTFTGPYPDTTLWCRMRSPEPETWYCSLEQGHVSTVHEAWYSGDDPSTQTPIRVWDGEIVLYEHGSWLI